MFEDSTGRPYGRARRILRWTWILPALAALYAGGVFYTRWDKDRQAEQRRIEQEREDARRSFEAMGGGRFEILSFYVTPGIVRRGEEVRVCYGVTGAKTVRLEPQPHRVWPSLSRCVTVTPQQDTTYTLTIEDAEGKTKTATVTVRVE